MNLKKYNKTTNSWDIIASGNASGISVTDPRFTQEDIHESVNDVLVYLDDKIEQTRRNLSWVVQNGTIGGGGGGSSTEAMIKITNAGITTIDGVNYLYATSNSVTLNYIITELRVNQKYYITVTLDGNNIITNQVAYSSIAGKIEIPDITAYTDRTSHSIVISAENENGIAIAPYMLTVVEASLYISSSVASVTATIGLPYYIQYVVTNKMLGQDTQVVVKNETNGLTKLFELGKFTSSAPKTLNVNFFELFEGGTPSAGSSYTITAYAVATVDDEQVRSEVITNHVVVEDGETLVVLVDGITEKGAEGDITEFDQSGNISFTFTPYLAGVNLIYYAIRIKRGSLTTDIGNFDADLSNYDQNQYTQRGTAKVFSWSIPQEDAYLGDYEITLRCWSDKGAPVTDKVLVCTVIPSDQSLLTTQIPNNSLYAQWHIKQASFPAISTAQQWTSYVSDFMYPGDTTPTPKRTELNVYDTNGVLSGFMTEGGQSKLRLIGESYGIIDLQPFVNDPSDSSTGIYNWGKRGFTFSLTFKTDKHPFSDRSVFFIGDYDAQGSLSQGIWVGLEDVIWKYKDGVGEYQVSCKIQQNVVTSLDFVVDIDAGELKIFVNGVLNVAREISNYSWQSTSKLYLACTNVNGSIENFADVEFYDINLFMQPLNDFQVVVNSMNARARASLQPSGAIDFKQYDLWKKNNFFGTGEANSMLWNTAEGSYRNLFFSDLIAQKVHLPVVLINCNGSYFTKEIYEEINASTESIYGPCEFQYHDPDTNETVTTSDVYISIQGTSSTGYRSKNIEIRFQKVLANGQYELFQPKASWMPENQFTLKADVVDSAHANNAAIGKWINDNADTLFDKTPPMELLDSHRPVNSGADTHKDQPFTEVTIKHTLEGFPFIFLIQFHESSTQEMLGIYSFNLGRASYYNMGMKFLKSFTYDIYNADDTITAIDKLPAFVTDYVEYGPNEQFGNITQSQIYSYEFGENANTIKVGDTMQPTALFMQDDMSIIQHVGEFKFNGGAPDTPDAVVTDNNVWLRLQLLFSVLSQMVGENTPKYKWDEVNGGYVETQDVYTPADWSSLSAALSQRISLRNAYSYFMICVVFGLVDSLGKNMVLRSWNVGGELTSSDHNKWWPCFYDMDTALGLSNTGEENVAKTAYIDIFKNADDKDGVNSLSISYNDPDGGYDTYSSRLWDVLRDDRFISTGTYDLTYEAIWDLWRINSKLIGGDPKNGISGSKLFVDDYFSSQTEGCGELLYNYDYRVKYLTKYKKPDAAVATYGNVQFLHGTRNDYVRDWLAKRLIFFDGVFMYANGNVIHPYNDTGAFSCAGAEAGNSELILKTNSPVIMTVNVGNRDIKRYFVNENVETSLYLISLSSFNTQIALNNLSEISMIGGLKDMRFQNFMDTMRLPSMAELDLSNVITLSSNPVDFSYVFTKTMDGTINSDIRHIDLSYTQFWAGVENPDFPVIINDYKKLKTLNISNSCVTSVALPNAALSELLLHDSAIRTITLADQPFIDEVNFSGCSKLTDLKVTNCNKIVSLDLRNMPNLTNVTIEGCSSLTSVNLSNCTKLVSVKITGASSLTDLNLSGCTNTELSIYLAAVRSLTSLNLSNTNTTNIIEFSEGFNSLKSLNLYSSNVTSFKFGTAPISMYNDTPVLDLSKFDLTSLDVRYNSSKYIKFKNSKSKPFTVSSLTFTGCTNLIRIFGHINLSSSVSFANLTNFTIHGRSNTEVPVEGAWYGPDTDEDSSTWDDDSDLQTNFTVSATSLYQKFYRTKCNMFDVYYILQKCDNVTNLGYTFAYCSNAVTDITNHLKRNTFAHCGKVTSAIYLFFGARVAGPLYSNTNDTTYDGLLAPLTSLTEAGAMFAGSGTKYIDDGFFGLCTNQKPLQFTSLSSFFATDRTDSIQIVTKSNESLTSSNVSQFYTYAKASKLLKNLPNINSLSAVFNNIRMHFDLVEYNGVSYCPLIANNTKLTSITRCFHNIQAYGSLAYLFGGHEVFDSSSLFPRKLSALTNFITVSSYNGTQVEYPIHNSMFKQIASVLTDINSYGSYSVSTAEVSLNGPGLRKVFLQEGDEQFPFDVFKKCTKLNSCPYFFAQLNVTTKPSDLHLPGDLFINNKLLTNINGCFASMSTDINYTLSSKGFINCQLTDVRNCFNDGGNKNKIGGIPYGLFYQERVQKKVFENGWSHSDAVSLGLSEDNTYDEGDTLPTAKTYSEQLKMRNRTITMMDSALRYFNSNTATAYTRIDTARTSIEDAGDLITQNESYDPREYIINDKWDGRQTITDSEGNEVTNPNYNPQYIIKNPAYSPYLYEWNIWYHDGTNGLGSIIESTTLWSKVQDGSITSLPSTLPDEFYDPDHGKQPSSYVGDRSDNMNFICPPDLFRYCSDQASTSIDYVLANSSYYTYLAGGRDRLNQGISGRIPKYLFKPLTKIQNIRYVFYECTCLTPYTWPDANGYGNMVHPDTFSGNTKLTNVSGIFRGIYVPEDVIIPDGLFNNNTSLQNLTELFYGSLFYGTSDSKAQVRAGLFNNNKLISNVSYLLGAPANSVPTNAGVKIIESGLFTAANHKNISSLIGFLQNQANTTGTVPAFWEWLNPTTANRSNIFLGVRKSNITNSAAIESAGWDTGMI